MGKSHTVQQGEHITRIARQYGFFDYKTVWSYGPNSDLRDQRESPNVLLPGDKLQIPDIEVKTESVPTGQTHSFVVPCPGLKLRLVLRDFDNQPLAQVDCEVEVAGKVQQIQTDGDGLLECTVPYDAEEGRLKVAALGIEIPLKIGHLDPPDAESGWKTRLANLGYWKPPDEPEDVVAQQLSYALQEFQCDFDLKVTGEADDATIAKLAQLHGA